MAVPLGDPGLVGDSEVGSTMNMEAYQMKIFFENMLSARWRGFGVEDFMDVKVEIWAHKKRTNHKADSAGTSRLGLRCAMGWRLTKVACAVLRAMHFETELASNFSEGVVSGDSLVLEGHLWELLR